ncbi:GntR family transcriptional regulator [Scrofimicrobium sp. R131]|uniref:GntR family transcriptional regulator n=1 Tax=Scrofimicrobium appendicitidis TaxID=3079930 RepID=A0AAU7V509_9ACTO
MMKHVPLWQRISAELRARIDGGQYDHDFPGELEVADEFGVSRGTARAALRPLREEGLVAASPGRRPRIRQGRAASQYGQIYSLQELIAESGLEPRNQVLRQSVVVDAEAGAELGSGPEVFLLERIRLGGENPIAYERVYTAADLAPVLTQVDFSDVAFYRVLADQCRIVITGGREQIEAIAAPDTVADLLECEPGTPLLQVFRWGCCATGVVEYRQTYFRGDRFQALRHFGSVEREHPCPSGTLS